MAETQLPKLVIFGDSKRPHVSEAIGRFKSFTAEKAKTLTVCGLDQCPEDQLGDCDFAVVFGGDGSILYAARTLAHRDIPIIGVNLGKLGFLAEFSIEELEQFFADIITGKVQIEKRMMISCTVLSNGAEKFRSTAINDVFVTAGAPFRAIELEISVSGQPLADCVSDGIIIATPTGSTAYNLSAGGPILTGNMHAMVITPICAHSLSFRPVVINAENTIEISGVKLNEGTTVSIDGQVSLLLTGDDTIRIEKEKSNFPVVNNPVRTQWKTLATKLRWAQKPKYITSQTDQRSV